MRLDVPVHEMDVRKGNQKLEIQIFNFFPINKLLQTFSSKEIEIIGRWEEQGRTFLKFKNKKYII